ncbi:MAG: bile acid:sodium symporter family protein [Bacteroidales bacterium]|nr:bile acid:sodium symporter family protein [Bacteroidales bacterium]
MNTVFIVMPILCLLMFQLGLGLDFEAFRKVASKPGGLVVGIVGQIVVLPMVAWILGRLFGLDPLFFIGIMLIACSPGGSSSNVFSYLAGGNVALSVTLTAVSSILTLFTIPLIMHWVVEYAGTGISASAATYDSSVSSAAFASSATSATQIHLPVGKLFAQNIVMMLVPILLGWGVQLKFAKATVVLKKWLGKLSFPALLLLASIFFLQHKETIIREFPRLGLCIGFMIIIAIVAGGILSRLAGLSGPDRKTIIIEVGMQNAAQAIAVACSPFIFANEVIAIPAIIYALLMNIVLLVYVWMVRR